ncbi:flagellar hook-basal body complex protein [Vibrio caribbeanicus]|uniref:flagellar hook-basal body complex protein n=1 Tax=Vibrio caribbeanicus TaxID=701175 RepID=UPI0030D7CF1C
MNKIPEIVLQSIKTDLAQVDRVSSNTSNVSKPGFKAYLSDKVGINHAQGELTKTSRVLDIAIEGSGWFVARKNDVLILTRNGQFQISNDGYLVTSSGYVLQGQSGDIALPEASFELRQQGEIIIDETYIDQFLTVEPTQNQLSQYNNGEIYLNSREKLKLSPSNSFRQGYLERSNSQPSEAVLQLMILNKHTQTMQKTYQAYDQIIQKTISELGK